MINIEYKGLSSDIEQELNLFISTTDKKLQTISELIRTQIEDNLYRGQSYLGGGLAPLKESTIKRKGHSRLFLDKGLLFDSVKLQQNSLKDFQIYIAEERVKVAAILTFGTDKMVSRPFFGINQETLNQIDKILEA